MLTNDKVLSLAIWHQRHFMKLLAEPAYTPLGRSVREAECKDYLRIWTIAKDEAIAGTPLNLMSEEVQSEVFDAVQSGDFDDLLGRGEFKDDAE